MSLNLFGIGEPQIKGDGTPDSTVRTLYRVTYLDRDFAIPQTYEGRSPITGFRNFGHLGDYAHFKIVINAWKYTAGVEGSTTKEILETLRTYHGKTVYFRPHKDYYSVSDGLGEYIEDDAGNDVKFFCRVIPIALEGVSYDKERIQIIMELDSVEYIDPLSMTTTVSP